MNSNDQQAELFGVIFHQERPHRLRPNDVIRVGNRLGRVIRVTDCAAVVVVNRPERQFTTRFDKKVRLQPSPLVFRISANSESEIVNAKPARKRKALRRAA